MPAPPGALDPRFVAAFELIGRTGAEEFQIRYCEEEAPTVWVALAHWHGHWEAGAGLDPLTAIFHLCDSVIDGGACTHCHKPTGFAPTFELLPDLWPETICWYAWDPELSTFRRGCE